MYFISTAFAQDGAAAAGGMGGLIQFLPLIAIVAIFYFLLIRPQQKRQKEHQAKIGAARRGDQVLTGGGIYGKVTKVLDDGKLQVEIAEGVRIRVAASTLMDVISKTEPAKTVKSDKDAAKDEDTKDEKSS
ncbi:preprotein translocase subunit YajC [Hwanghaeella sp.]|uniref:preprotein translocase subunit YajC n=1 Tax=Hwanghaeella sp. TaxID=2605943 RepID=UPI003CCC33E1